MTLIDKWTPLFLALATVAWLTDYICFRYRGNILVESEPGHDPHRQAFEKILKDKK